jgi:hypothetical protein
VIAHGAFPGLLTHDDDELGLALGSPIVARKLVHEWPLTRTERVTLRDGRVYAYKAQLPPSVELPFYSATTSRVLAPFRDLGSAGRTSFIATEWIDASSLHTLPLTDEEFVAHAKRVVGEIGGIRTGAPVFLDLASREAFQAQVDATCERMDGLIRDGWFTRVSAEAIGRVSTWSRSDAVVRAIETTEGVAHGDLSAEEVFRVDDGYRVIDWQRPVRGPSELDLVSLLRHRRLNPRDYVAGEYVELAAFLLLYWAALVSVEVLPDLPHHIPESWAVSAVRTISGAMPG